MRKLVGATLNLRETIMRMKLLTTTVAAMFGLAASTGFAAERLPQKGVVAKSGVASQLYVQTPQPELIYVPIAPCRAVSAQTIAAAQKKTFQLTGAGFEAQGGPAAGCGVPASATAVSISFTTSNTTAGGLLTAYAANTSRPGVATMILQAASTTASSTVALSPAGAMWVYANKSVRIYGDVTGYYAPQIQAYVSNDGSLFSSTSRVLSATRTGVGTYRIIVDRDVYYCSAFATTGDANVFAAAVADADNTVYVSLTTVSGGGVERADATFNLSVHC